MNAQGKQRNKYVDGHADTALPQSTGGAFDRTELSGPGLASRADKTDDGIGGGTVTDLSLKSGKRKPRPSRPEREITRSERYDVKGEFARGGLGRILEARDVHLGRTVAIKELLESSNFAESLFIREALVTARLQHPGIVPVHEAGRWLSGDPYYVMKLLSGETLQKRIRGKRDIQDRLSLLPNVLDVVETIAYAHSQGIIHRDIKPANIVVGEFGETVVVDWGLARDDKEPIPPVESEVEAQSEAEAKINWQISGNYSVSGKVVGTPAYMSPEQARGGDVDERTDVYALGALMFEVLSGKPPYPGKNLQEVLLQVLVGPPTSLAEKLAADGGQVKPELITIVERAMARDRDDRYPSAQELAADLRRFQTGQLVSVHQYKTWTLVKRWIRKHRAPLGVAVAAVAILAVLGAVSVNRIVEERNVARFQQSKAQRAESKAVLMKNKLIFEHAESSLASDPTTTIASLQAAPLQGGALARARTLAEQAVALGVAKHVVEGPDQPSGLAFTPDGRHVVVADMGGALFTIDVDTGAKRILATHKARFGRLALSRDGSRLAVCSAREIMVFAFADLETPIARLPSEGMVEWVWFSDDGLRLHTWHGGVEVGINLWDIAAGEKIRSGSYSTYGASSAALDRAAELLDEGQVVVVRDTVENTELARFAAPVPIKRALMSKRGDRVLAFGADRFLYVFQLADGSIHKRGKMSGGQFSALRKLFMYPDPSDNWLVSRTGETEPITLFDLTSDRVQRLSGHRETVFQVQVSPDNSFAVTNSDDMTIRIWDLASDAVRILRGHTDDVYRTVVSPDSALVASMSRDRTVRIWSVRAGEPKTYGAPKRAFMSVAFTGAEQVVGTTAGGHSWRYDLATGERTEVGDAKRKRTFRDEPSSPDGRYITIGNPRKDEMAMWDIVEGTMRALPDAPTDIYGRSWAPDSSGYALQDRSGAVRFWSARRDQTAVLAAGETRCGVAVSPGSERIALIMSERVDVYRLPAPGVSSAVSPAAGPPVKVVSHDIAGDSLPCHMMGSGTRAGYSPDGKHLVVMYPYRGMIIIDTATGATRELAVSRQSAGLLSFSHDSRYVASWHQDMAVHLVDLATGHTRRLGYHGDLVFSLVFSPDGTTLASSSYDRSLRLWDVDGDDHRVIRNHAGPVWSTAYSPDGRRLASVSEDGTLRVWDTSTPFAPDAASLRAYLDAQTSADTQGSSLARTRRAPGTGSAAFGDKPGVLR